MTFTNQAAFDVRCEWGARGIAALAACRTFIVVDVLSFSTCVAIAVSRHATVFPYPFKQDGAAYFAKRHHAVLAGPRGDAYSLSPASLVSAPSGLRLVLPSPNGAAVSLEAEKRGQVLAGCIRNRSAVSARAVALGGPVAIVPAGERWGDGTFRHALEDLIGAGAIAAVLPGTRSPETEAAVAVFQSVTESLSFTLSACASGRELIERGFAKDIELASMLDADRVAPELIDGRFVRAPSRDEAA